MQRRISAVLVLLFGLGYCEMSAAALGGAFESVVADQKMFQAERHSSAQAAYQVHELAMSSGTLVREYADAAGRVFAVTWRGTQRPDFKQLLGASFQRVSDAALLPRPDHRALLVNQADLVVESTGHMRAFIGRAYLPLMVPAGRRRWLTQIGRHDAPEINPDVDDLRRAQRLRWRRRRQ